MVYAPACPKDVSQVCYKVSDYKSSQHAVETQQQEGNDSFKNTIDLVAAVGGGVSLDRCLAGFTAKSDFSKHQRVSNEDGKYDVDQQECKSSVHTHLVWEAPDVAKTDGGTDSSHQETEITSKAALSIIV